MKKNLIIFLSILLFQTSLYAQKKDKYLFNTFIFGTSVTSIDVGMYEPVHEIVWNINAATSVGKRFFVGVQVLNLFIKSNYFDTKLYRISGMFTQFSLAPYSKFRPFLELSFNKGDYYFPSDSYNPENGLDLYYVGMGFGSDMPLSFISKNLFFHPAFVFYYIEGKGAMDNFNQYIIGFNYRFGKMVSKPLKKYKK